MNVRVSDGVDKLTLFNPCADIDKRFRVLDRLFKEMENGNGVFETLIREARKAVLEMFSLLLRVNNPRVWQHLKFRGDCAYQHAEGPARWARGRTERIADLRKNFTSKDPTPATFEKALVSIATGFQSMRRPIKNAVIKLGQEHKVTELSRYEITAIVTVVNMLLRSARWKQRVESLQYVYSSHQAQHRHKSRTARTLKNGIGTSTTRRPG